MNDIIDEINDRLNTPIDSSELEIKEPHIELKDAEYYEQKKLEEAPSLIEELETNNKKPVVDEYTGEIRRFRSSSAIGSYCFKEVATQPTETDSKMYEPLETTIEKCSRAPALRALMKNNMQLMQDGTPDPDMDADFDETLRPGYDIADAAETMNTIGEAIATPKPTNEATSAENEVSNISEPKAE